MFNVFNTDNFQAYQGSLESIDVRTAGARAAEAPAAVRIPRRVLILVRRTGTSGGYGMSMKRMAWVVGPLMAAARSSACTHGCRRLRQSSSAAPAQAAGQPRFELVQPDLFAAPGGQPNCWADFDGDGDLDLFVGFRQGEANRLYRNDNGTFVNVATELGVADITDTRAAAWGDFDADGDVDLFVGFTRKSVISEQALSQRRRRQAIHRRRGGRRSRRSRARAGSRRSSTSTTTATSTCFVGLRDAPNMLFRNDGGRFASVGKEMGLDDPRRTVGAVWFDMDQDGDLDVFVANQNGDLNGLFRNDGARFVDVAHDARCRCRRPGPDVGQQRSERRRLRQRRRPRSVRRRLRSELPLPQ